MAAPRPFRFGAATIPVRSRGEWIDYARKVEDLGYSTLSVSDHPAWGGIEATVGLMAAADATNTLRLASHVFANDFHHPVVLAESVATLDLLSDGRVEFGIGAGWLRSDYDACGLPFDAPSIRIGRLEEAIHVIRGLWGDEPVTFEGSHYRVTELDPHPKPKQRPHPPIFIGGGGRRMLSLAAREADIVGLDPKGTPGGSKDLATTTGDAADEQIGWIRDAAGSRFSDLELHNGVTGLKVTTDRRRGAEELAAMTADLPSTVIANPPSPEHILGSPQYLVGTVDQIVEDLQARRERYGISYITVFGDYVDDFSAIVRRLAGT